ncbi:MAG TPA: undecaprenyl/decaprenyl-phosphate alpha-N-acetylglucosaminyl 1-phosphate transferase, partial [Firmicutes bacterium]|nr:undecaprenyl/decaprenyl-phosphate alpha-N-acetylglucosaminyl 1-phosphate transferase [Bacillota bacterium]
MDVAQFVIVFVIALTVTAVSTPLARRFALRMGLVDLPNPRRI